MSSAGLGACICFGRRLRVASENWWNITTCFDPFMEVLQKNPSSTCDVPCVWNTSAINKTALTPSIAQELASAHHNLDIDQPAWLWPISQRLLTCPCAYVVLIRSLESCGLAPEMSLDQGSNDLGFSALQVPPERLTGHGSEGGNSRGSRSNGRIRWRDRGATAPTSTCSTWRI